MFNQFVDGSQVNLLIALLGGFITFFASCLLPLVPAYLAYLSGVSLSGSEAKHQRGRIVRMATLFVIGFITVFVAIGATLNRFAALLAPYRLWGQRIGGVVFILLGLFLLGVFKSKLFQREVRIDVHGVFKKHAHLHAIITGMAFGFGWTPCIGPVLAVILFWAAQQASVWQGIGLLVAYGIGLGIPFILIGFGFERLVPLLKKYGKFTRYSTYLSGAIVLLIGMLMLLGLFEGLSIMILDKLHLRTLAV